MTNTPEKNLKTRLGIPILVTIIVIALPFVMLALIEGTASLALFARSVRGSHLVEEHFTERDTLLGWISVPNTSKPNLFGEGRSLHTNAQGFRHAGDVAPTPPAGKTRVICSGDSFTLGYGVDDAKTWCALLAANQPSLETINMGLNGYGIDQAYLRYVRDGMQFRPAVHLFSIINDDFRRMTIDRFAGFPKPRLAVDSGGTLRTVGVPVPNPGMGPFTNRLLTAVGELRTFELLQLFTTVSRSGWGATPENTWKVAEAINRDLAAKDSAIGAKLIVVYLPTIDDFKGKASDKWRQWIRDAAARDKYTFVDLVPDLRKVAPDSVDALFIPRGQLAFLGAAGHYTDAGNVWVEKLLRARIPELAPLASK